MEIKYSHTYYRGEPTKPHKMGDSFNTYAKARRWAGRRGCVTKVTKVTVITETVMPSPHDIKMGM